MTTEFEKFLKLQDKANLFAFLDLGLAGHTLQSLFSPFHNRKFPHMSHTSGFHVKFFKKVSSNDAKSLKMSMSCGP